MFVTYTLKHLDRSCVTMSECSVCLPVPPGSVPMKCGQFVRKRACEECANCRTQWMIESAISVCLYLIGLGVQEFVWSGKGMTSAWFDFISVPVFDLLMSTTDREQRKWIDLLSVRGVDFRGLWNDWCTIRRVAEQLGKRFYFIAVHVCDNYTIHVWQSYVLC